MLILTFTLLFLSSCFFSEDGKIEINPLNSSFGTSNAQVSSVSIVNDQLVVNGSGLGGITKVQITGPSSFDHTFSIESASDSNLIANGVSNIAFALDAIFSLTVTDANGSATYNVTFTLQDDAVTTSKILDGAVTAAKLSDMGAGTGQVLKYNGTTWVPGDLNALTYAGTWDASTATAPNVAPAAGEYYIVSVAAAGIDISDGSGSRNFVLGDWLVYNGSTTRWDKIDNASYVTSFNGRSGAVTPATNDYTWAQIDKSASILSNINDVEAPAGDGTDTGKVLKWNNATSTWELGDDLSGGGAGSVTSTEIANGTITNDDVNAAAAIAYSKLNIADGDLTIAKTSGLQTTLDAKLPLAGGTMTGSIVMSGAQTVDGVDVSTLATSVSTNTSTIAGLDTDDITEATNLYFTDARAKASAVVNSTAGTETDQAASVSAMKTYVAAQVSGAGAVLADGSVAMTGNLDLGNNQLRLKSDNTNYVQMIAPNSLAATYTLTMPADDGTSGQVLSTNGTGTLSWVSPASGSVTSVTGTAPIVSSGGTTPAISIAQANGSTDGFLDSADWTTFNNKQAAITTGTTAQYLRGDLSLSTFGTDVIGSAITGFTSGAGTVAATDTVLQAVQKLDGNIAANTSTISGLDTDDITEATNQYFTNARAIAAPITGFTSGAGTVAATDTVLQAIQKLDGNVAALDTDDVTEATNLYFTDARAKASAVVNSTAGTETDQAASVSAMKTYVAAQVSGSGAVLADGSVAMTGNLDLGNNQLRLKSDNTNYVQMIAPNSLAATYTLTMPADDGTSGQVLSTNGTGTLSWVSPASGSVTSVTGTAPIVSSGGTTPSISIAQANGSTDGFLDSADWTTFNNKQAAITTGTTAQYLRGDLSLSTFGTDVIGSAITGFTSGAGTVAATDTVLQAIQKLDGNIAAAGDILDGGNTNGAAVTIGTNDAQALNLETNNSTAVTIDSSGNVGVGTTSPVGLFHVQDASAGVKAVIQGNGNTGINTGGILSIRSSGTSNWGSINFTDGATANGYIGYIPGTGAATRLLGFANNAATPNMVIDGSGNIGAGTLAPDASAILDLTSTSKGFAPPRMTTTQRDAISSPATGLQVYNTTTSNINYYDGSNWQALNGEAKYIKLGMSADQTVGNGDTVAFNTILTNNGFTSSGNGVDLKSGVTYRIEAVVNWIHASGSMYLGYTLNNGTSNIGKTAYTNGAGSSTAHGMKAAILEFYTPSSDETIYVNIADDNIGTGSVQDSWNTYFVVTEMIGAGAGGGADHLGNHTATQNVQLGTNYISNDGGASEGLTFDTSGNATFTGTVTGTSFSGSGANLTNIPTAAIDNNAITVDKVDFASSNGINIPQVASAPGSPTTGQMYFNTSDSKLYIYNGTSWEEVGSGSSGTDVSFSVNKNSTNQTITADTWTKLTWSTESIDSNSNFASDRFTPTVAGKYLVGGQVYCFDNTSWCHPAVYKNGSIVQSGGNDNNKVIVPVTTIVEMNGTTDYLELYAYNAGGTTIVGAPNYTYFYGYLISGGGGGNADDLGNHTATQNIQLGSNYLSGDGGNEGLSVDSTGMVGIGTATPVAMLTVDEAGGGATPTMRLRDASATRYRSDFALGSAGAGLTINSYDDTGATYLPVRVDASTTVLGMEGNVGIGTDSPTGSGQVLHLHKSGTTSGDVSDIHLTTGTTGTTSTDGTTIRTNNDGSLYIINREAQSMNFLTSNTNAMTIDSSQNVGVGTTTPAGKLDVNGSICFNGANCRTSWPTGSGTGAFTDTGSLAHYTGGNVGIGTTAPSSALHVYSSQNQPVVIETPNANTWLDLKSTAGTWSLGANSSNQFSIYGDRQGTPSVRFVLDSSGNVGIGTTSPSYKLHVVGSAGKTTGTAWTSISDRRLKDIQGSYEFGLAEIMQLNTVRFNYSEGNELKLPSDENIVGFIAQEVQQVIPDAVMEREDGFLELNVDPIHWAMVNATQEQQRIIEKNIEMMNVMRNGIEANTREIASLKAKNLVLENEVLNLKNENQEMKAKNEKIEQQLNDLKSVVCSMNPSAKICQ